MSRKKIIAVLGATGSQGGGLARAILADPEGPFADRALTRNAQGARALAAAGAEVVEADLFDESSLRRAFDGAYGAFVVTNYWVERTPEEEAAQTRVELELAQAQAAAKAAKDAGLAHVIWSTLEDTREHFGDDDRVPTVDDNYKVPHVEFREFPMPFAVEIANMFQFYAEDSERFTGDRDLDLVRELNPDLQSFKTWLAKDKHEIPRG